MHLLRTLAFALAMVLALAACDGDGNGGDSGQAGDAMEEIADAAGNTLEQDTARSVISLQQGPADEQETGQGGLQLHGEEMFGEDRRRLAMGGLPGEEDAAVPGGEIIVDGTDVYLLAGGPPAPGEGTGDGEEQWLRLNLEAVAEDAQTGSGSPGFLFRDSLLVLEALHGAEGEASASTAADDETADGERYEVGLDPDTLPADVDAWWQGMAPAGQERLEMDVWIDRVEGLITRVDYFPVGRTAGSEGDAAGAGMAVSISYSDFGTRVDIALPDDDLVTELSPEEVRGMLPGAGAPGGASGGDAPGAGDTGPDADTDASGAGEDAPLEGS
jgi:hypothetical protein